MKIGLDLSVIQTPHRMRGIGATAINFVNNLSEKQKKDHQFVFYLFEDDQDKALSILNLQDITYEIRNLMKPQRITLNLPGRLRAFNSLLKHVQERLEVFVGDKRIDNLDGVDVFLSFDQMQTLPKKAGLKTAVILYDLIPYIMEADYLWSYKTARKNLDSRKSSIRKALLRRQYIAKAKSVAQSADTALAISQHTKDDFVKYARINPSKIQVVHLGINEPEKSTSKTKPTFQQYLPNSWGFYKQPIELHNKPFLLFVGGADPRRKLNDLVGAYNNLKAQGYDIRLVFAGDTMKGPAAIPVPETQKYLNASSYPDDIIYLGFVTDEEREWLYGNALAFIYPSVYEGFGLPILEAMQYGTPVVTYKNSSIMEIAGDAAIYTEDALSIKDASLGLLGNKSRVSHYSKLSKEQAGAYSWKATTKNILAAIIS